MSLRQWLALFGFYITYLVLGASIFWHIENRLEAERRINLLESRIEINELLTKYTSPSDKPLQNLILEKLTEYCGKKVTKHTKDEFVDPFQWTFFHSFMFALTVCTTVGYGNLAPTTHFGRLFMIFYAFIGIPVNGIMFAYMGDYFGRALRRQYQRYKAYKLSNNENYAPRRFSMISRIILYLIPGLVVFLFLPAGVFAYFENWHFIDGLYYAFVTLTTVGFGDMVATFQPNTPNDHGAWFIVYQIWFVIWFVIGLGYLVMIMTFLAKGLRSKHIAKLEHQLSQNIRATQNRIWQGVSKDVSFLRRFLNEIYLVKVQPVYNEPNMQEALSIPRSASCPELFYNPPTVTARKRAFSENYDASCNFLAKTVSDTDLTRINKEKTFEAMNEFMQTGDLLARVVTALGNIGNDNEVHNAYDGASTGGGIHGFSDSQILASERTLSGWSLPTSEYSNTLMDRARNRSRAFSVFNVPADPPEKSDDLSHEWTWSGDDKKLQSIVAERIRTKSQPDNLYKSSFGNSIKKNDRSVTINIPDYSEAVNDILKPSNKKSFLGRLNPFKAKSPLAVDPSNLAKRHSLGGQELDVQLYLQKTVKGRESRISLPRRYMRTNSIGSVTQADEVNANLLENTTIADLIRALEVVHTKNLTSAPDEEMPARRKMGTASLTPPSAPSLVNLFQQSQIASGMRRSSLKNTTGRRASTLPPPYDTGSPKNLRRRFSVRPTNLSIPPGQAPPVAVASTALQRRLSMRPSPLVQDHLQPQRGLGSANTSRGTAARTVMWRPTHLHPKPSRQSSLTEIGGVRKSFDDSEESSRV